MDYHIPYLKIGAWLVAAGVIIGGAAVWLITRLRGKRDG